MSTFALPRQSMSSIPRKKPLSKQMEIGITAVLVVIGLTLAILSLSYLFYANSRATQDYHLRVLQEKRAAIVNENEVLGMRIAKLESLNTLQENTKIQAMVTSENPLFIRHDVTVAKNSPTLAH